MTYIIPLYWADVLMGRRFRSCWYIDHMSPSAGQNSDYKITQTAFGQSIYSEKIIYTLPIIEEQEENVKIYKPPFEHFFILESPINGWDLPYVWVPRKTIKINTAPNFCLDCGWYCFQQCHMFDRRCQRLSES